MPSNETIIMTKSEMIAAAMETPPATPEDIAWRVVVLVLATLWAWAWLHGWNKWP